MSLRVTQGFFTKIAGPWIPLTTHEIRFGLGIATPSSIFWVFLDKKAICLSLSFCQ
jgi:hypothetical protein